MVVINVYVYSPGAGAGADNPPGLNYFSLTHLFSQFSPVLQVFPIKRICNSFPHSNV